MGSQPRSQKEIRMTTTFQKRQKEMKRLDKQKEKAARRAQRKIEKQSEKENGTATTGIEHIQLGPQERDPDDLEDGA
jgi:hypothetical protein